MKEVNSNRHGTRPLCPRCQSQHNRVLDARYSTAKQATLRRRRCSDCGHRFRTYEVTQERAEYVRKLEKEIERIRIAVVPELGT